MQYFKSLSFVDREPLSCTSRGESCGSSPSGVLASLRMASAWSCPRFFCLGHTVTDLFKGSTQEAEAGRKGLD